MRTTPLVALLALPLLVALALFASRAPEAAAVEPGVNCATYAEGVCVVPIGDLWFCDSAFQNGACPSSIFVGETVRWQNNSSVAHTSTECGGDCPTPASSLWDSGSISPGGTFDLTFDDAGIFNYYCEVHPAMRGIIRVLEEGDVLGDVDCGGTITSIDAALVLQFGAALLDSLPCAQNADTSGDGQTNSLDAALILQYSARLIDDF